MAARATPDRRFPLSAFAFDWMPHQRTGGRCLYHLQEFFDPGGCAFDISSGNVNEESIEVVEGFGRSFDLAMRAQRGALRARGRFVALPCALAKR